MMRGMVTTARISVRPPTRRTLTLPDRRRTGEEEAP
jgi:hypothetical protein